tara:strand:- start:93 stop:314 length:222 start_codon:yes stop_codon:yes gene_type:complete
METVYKILLVTLLVGGLVFARSGKNNPRVEDKKVKSEHYWVKDQSENGDNNKLDRKRSHKRRRKIRKPIKGLR